MNEVNSDWLRRVNTRGLDRDRGEWSFDFSWRGSFMTMLPRNRFAYGSGSAANNLSSCRWW